jgi:hypothetical protein
MPSLLERRSNDVVRHHDDSVVVAITASKVLRFSAQHARPLS